MLSTRPTIQPPRCPCTRAGLPVGAEQCVAFNLAPAGGAHLDHVVRLGKTINRYTRMQSHRRLLRHRVQQQAVQVGAVNGAVGGAVACNRRRAQGQFSQHFAVNCAAHLQGPS